MKFALRVQHRTKSASFASDPKEQEQSDHQHERRANSFQKLDGFDSAPHDHHVDRPKQEKTDPAAAWKTRGAWPQNSQHRKNRLPAYPGLDAKPAASHQRPQYCWYIRPSDSK